MLRGKKIIDIIVVGRVSVWANPPYEVPWKNKIIEAVKPIAESPTKNCSIRLKFYISEERLTVGNDVDNLAKPVLDALKAAGAIVDDPSVFNLDVTKVPATDEEKVHIELWKWITH